MCLPPLLSSPVYCTMTVCQLCHHCTSPWYLIPLVLLTTLPLSHCLAFFITAQGQGLNPSRSKNLFFIVSYGFFLDVFIILFWILWSENLPNKVKIIWEVICFEMETAHTEDHQYSMCSLTFNSECWRRLSVIGIWMYKLFWNRRVDQSYFRGQCDFAIVM